jgi:UDP-3-O-[3-hydroxymyristoyl] glucosamine N-acyltransferase
VRLSDLATRLGCDLRGDGELDVVRVRGLDEAGPGDLAFLANPRYAPQLATTRASAVIVAPTVETRLPSLLSPNPYLAFAGAVALLHPAQRPAPGIHPSAQIDPSVSLGEGVTIDAFVVIGPRVRLGARTVIRPHVVLCADVEIGEDCLLHSGVHVREGCRLGRRVILQNGVVIGGDGFGFAKDDAGRYHKIPQVGTVVIEDDVEIQSNTTVDRAALGETRIGRGTKIDNLVQVAHSVSVGADSVLCAQVGVAGSSRIGSRVTLAGQVGVADHVTVGDDVVATAQTGVPHAIESGRLVSGYPAIDNRAWLRAVALFARLPELWQRLRALERRLGSTPQEK